VSNPQKRKGDKAERDTVKALQALGFPYAERSRAGWADDKGDIQGIPTVVVEVKDQRRHDLAGWLRELEAEKANAEVDTGVLVVKRAGFTDASDWYAITTLADWAAMAKEAGH
jgi:hypothetical protein